MDVIPLYQSLPAAQSDQRENYLKILLYRASSTFNRLGATVTKILIETAQLAQNQHDVSLTSTSVLNVTLSYLYLRVYSGKTFIIRFVTENDLYVVLRDICYYYKSIVIKQG